MLWALGVQNRSVTRSGGLLGLMCRPLRAAKRAAQLSRPSWVVFALPPVSGGPGTVEGLNFHLRQPPSSVELSKFGPKLWCKLGPVGTRVLAGNGLGRGVAIFVSSGLGSVRRARGPGRDDRPGRRRRPCGCRAGHNDRKIGRRDVYSGTSDGESGKAVSWARRSAGSRRSGPGGCLGRSGLRCGFPVLVRWSCGFHLLGCGL